MNKEKHQDIKYTKGLNSFKLVVNDPKFKKATELDDDIFEVEVGKSQINLSLPIQLGYFILQYGKLRMLQFYYDFLDRFVHRSDFEYLEMDTDSAYMAISSTSLDNIIKPDLKEEYLHNIQNMCHVDEIEASTDFWFPRTCCNKHKMFDRRTPSLFKLEAEGEEMLALCSKTYLLKSGDKCKLTCKGINKNSVTNPLSIFKEVLRERSTFSANEPNRGFRAKDNTMFSYTQSKDGFGYFYCKREVCSNGINTVPLNVKLCPWPDHNISAFQGDKDPLSNMYFCEIHSEGKIWHSSEQFYLYKKAIHHDAHDIADKILQTSNGYQMKVISKDIKTKYSWYDIRVEVMEQILELKLENSLEFRRKLANSNDKLLVYSDKYDKFWGCGLEKSVACVTDPQKFPGQNQLGQLLMEIRNNKLTKLKVH